MLHAPFWTVTGTGVHYKWGRPPSDLNRVSKPDQLWQPSDGSKRPAEDMNSRSEEPNGQEPHDSADDASSGFLLKLAANQGTGSGRQGLARHAPLSEDTPDHRLSRAQAPRLLIFGFAGIILLGTVLLKLPAATTSGSSISWMEALFTSTSAVTVTGLGVLTTATDFSRFGQFIILVLLQVGGVGFIAFSVLLFRLVGRRVTLNERYLIQQSLGAERQFTWTRNWGRLGSVANLALYVLIVTVSIEAIGTLLLWLRWRTELPDGEALWLALFHTVSSYCNAGFDLFAGTEHAPVFGFGADYYTLAVMSALIVLGGVGVAVLYDVVSYFRNRMLSLNSRITLGLTVVLLIVGLAVMSLDRHLYEVTLAAYSLGEQIAISIFTVISSRTAGLTILPLHELSQSTQLMLLFWMFVGGAPASMAGGVTTSTFGVLLISALATAKGGDNQAVAFGRSVPRETLNKAFAIMTVSSLLIAAVTIVLSLFTQGDIFELGFEVVSAFANAGYSLGFTHKLNDWGQALIAFTMFWGRLGPLTIVIALAQRERPSMLRYPEEPVILG